MKSTEASVCLTSVQKPYKYIYSDLIVAKKLHNKCRSLALKIPIFGSGRGQGSVHVCLLSSHIDSVIPWYLSSFFFFAFSEILAAVDSVPFPCDFRFSSLPVPSSSLPLTSLPPYRPPPLGAVPQRVEPRMGERAEKRHQDNTSWGVPRTCTGKVAQRSFIHWHYWYKPVCLQRF